MLDLKLGPPNAAALAIVLHHSVHLLHAVPQPEVYVAVVLSACRHFQGPVEEQKGLRPFVGDVVDETYYPTGPLVQLSFSSFL